MNCCFRAKHKEIITVGAGETFDYRIVLTVKGGGPFESGIAIFLEDHGIREVVISVTGTCVGGEDGK